MQSNDFGSLLRSLRKMLRMTQSDACKDICSLRQYVRLEKNISEPSMYLVQLLSHRFNYDLLTHYKLIYCDMTLQANAIKSEADDLIKQRKYNELYPLILKADKLSEFKRGENLQCSFYYKSLYYYHAKNDIELALHNCINGLHAEDSQITSNNFKGKISSNVGLSLLNILACFLQQSNKSDKAIEIWTQILIDIEEKMSANFTYYQSSVEFIKQLYLSTCYNIGLLKTDTNDLISAIDYFDKGISFASKYNCLYYLAYIVRQKMRVLYTLKRFDEARASYDICMALYLLRGDLSELRSCEKIMKEDYPELSIIKMYD